MKVVCIKNFLSTSLQHELTYGKTYDAYDPVYTNEDSYYVKCDRGAIISYSKSIFMPLEEWRNNQLNRIGI
jgi:hypothetical protein